MSASPTPAPPQTIKGTNEFDDSRQNVLTDNKGNLQIRSFEMEKILREILNEIRIIRGHFEILTGEIID